MALRQALNREQCARADLAFLEAQLRGSGRIAPVGSDPEERQRWLLHDLASLIEGCFHERVNLAALDEPAKASWQARLGKHFIFRSVESWDDYLLGDERRYWLLDRHERAGTVALGSAAFTGPWLRVSSLYVLPEYRQRGLAGTLLDRAAFLAPRRSLVGLRLGTSWTWQNSLRFYLTRGFWVRSWKHDIQLVLEPELPKRICAISDDTASLSVHEAREDRLTGEEPVLVQRGDIDLVQVNSVNIWRAPEDGRGARGSRSPPKPLSKRTLR